MLCDPARGLFVVADGLGGHRGGEVASRTAIDALDRTLQVARLAASTDDAALLRTAIVEAHEAVVAAQTSGLEDMGTTVVVALVRPDGRTTVAHVGDSRAYRWRTGMLERLTRDHTVPTGFGRLLTQALGSPAGVEPDCVEVHFEDGDLLLLCSDGLTDVVSDRGIAELVAAGGSCAAIADRLVEAALAGGGPDNVTVVVVRPVG